MKNYQNRVPIIVIGVVALLITLRFVPPIQLGAMELRRADILSQVAPQYPQELPEIAPIEEDQQLIDLDSVAAAVAIAQQQFAQQHTEDSLSTVDTLPTLKEFREVLDDSLRNRRVERVDPEGYITPIEEYDTTSPSPFKRLYDKLSLPGETTRIAVMGDSFIEADILTSDIRDILQRNFGGRGVGFVTFETPITRYRRSISIAGEGWEANSILKRDEAPANTANSWFVSDYIATMVDTVATARWECSSWRKRLVGCTSARLIFRATTPTTIYASTNDNPSKEYVVEPSAQLQSIELHGDSLYSLAIEVRSERDTADMSGFTGYGAVFEGDGAKGGVVVDNFSIRGNNGRALLWSDAQINSQINSLMGGYDLVILQYGLNIMQSGVSDYGFYARQMENIVGYIQRCFPQAAIIMMGVSERRMLADGHYQPMEEVEILTRYQRTAARNAGVAFWPMSEAMARMGGMSQFVENGWASKDHIHIGWAGGREIGHAFVEALDDARIKHFIGN